VVRTETLLQAASELEKLPLNERHREIVREVEERLRADRLYVAVVGEFKRGKSTFVNALLGDRILPTGVLPLTNVVTLIEWGERPELRILYRNGSVGEAPLAELSAYVTEKENPGNVREVRIVRIFHPSPFLRGGLVLADTPGVESLFGEQTEEARSFLPRVDLGVLLLSADSPLSGREMTFLEDLRSHAAACFVLLNKVDFLAPSDREGMEAFVRERITERFPDLATRVFPLSARLALEGIESDDSEALAGSGLPEIRAALETTTRRDRGRIQAEANGTRLLGAVRSLRAAARVERESLLQPIDRLEERIRLFSEGVEELTERRREAEILLERELDVLTAWLEAELDGVRERHPQEILGALETRAREWTSLATPEYAARLTAAAGEELRSRFERWLEKSEEELELRYQALSERYRKRLTDLLAQLMKLGSEAFSLDLETWEMPEEFSRDRRFTCLEGETRPFFDLEGIALSLRERLAPRSLGQRFAFERITARIPQRVDANCGRIRFDLVRRLKDSYLRFRGRLSGLMEEAAGEIERAARSALAARGEAEEVWSARRDELARRLDRLDEIERILASAGGERPAIPAEADRGEVRTAQRA